MIKNIIFPGGGFKGWAYIGTIRALNELIDLHNIETVIGIKSYKLYSNFIQYACKKGKS